MRLPLIALALASSLALAGCDTLTQTAKDTLMDAATNATGDKATVKGKIFASADQVAIIATGGLNYGIFARSDEKGVKEATVKLKELGGSASATAQTDTAGAFTVKVAKGTYEVTATFTAKDESSVTLTGLVVVDGASESLELDVAHNMVASKLLEGGAKTVDGAKLAEAVSKLSSDLESVSKAPTPKNRTEAAAKFDEHASADAKSLVEEVSK